MTTLEEQSHIHHPSISFSSPAASRTAQDHISRPFAEQQNSSYSAAASSAAHSPLNRQPSAAAAGSVHPQNGKRAFQHEEALQQQALLGMHRGEMSADSRAKYASTSPPQRLHAPRAIDRHVSMGNGRASPPTNVNGPLPPYSDISPLRGDGDDAMNKRRRLEFDQRAEADFHHSSRTALRPYPDDRYVSGRPTPPHLPERRSIGDDSFDPAIPLARRRGDAAQAKASRLHIETGYSPDSASAAQQRPLQAAGRTTGYYGPSGHLSHAGFAHHGAKSAPPYKVAFSEHEHPPGAAYRQHGDPRAELPPLPLRGAGGYGAPGGQAHGPPSHYGPASSYKADARREAGAEEYEMGEGPGRPREPVHAAVASLAGTGQSYRGAPPPGAGTPLTATRNAFVPQTATLPSPAYHTTQFVRQAAGGSAAPAGAVTGANGNGAAAINGSALANGANGSAVPATATAPRTGALNPPMTARLPDHMRSPPSNKTQFLSLFSNFYDSLQDSRTLKVTLEDQVRRSNTLLQTLQRSARVLELTVERRLTAERSLWESKVQALEDRCRRLERATGAGSPTPPREEDEKGSAALNEGKSNGGESGEVKDKAQDESTAMAVDDDKADAAPQEDLESGTGAVKSSAVLDSGEEDKTEETQEATQAERVAEKSA